MTLQNRYDKVCNEYAVLFCKKQMFDETEYSWVADEVGGVLECSGFYFNFQDVVWDMNSKQKPNIIIDWYYASIENAPKSMNYYSYTKGLRFNQL